MGLNNSTMGSGSNIAHFAHLGGMVIGFAYIKFRQQGWSISDWIDKTFPKTDTKGPVLYKKETREPVSEEEIDRILDKISSKGYESLTDEEKKKLLKAGGR